MNKNRKFSVPGFYYCHRCDENATQNLNTRHCHDDYEILYVTEGSGRYLIEGAEFELSPRTLVLIRPFEYHCVEVDSNSAYERYVLNFSASCIAKEVKPIFDGVTESSEPDSGCFYAPEMLNQAIISTFDRFETAEYVSDSEKELFFKLILSELIVLLSSSARQRIVHSENELGAKVARYINAYLDKNISLDIIAKKFFISKYYLCRSFKKYSGVSIHAYINHKRVMYAKQLIDSGETASGAAYKVGFGDYSAFYRAYVKALGKPPTSK